MIDSFSGGGGGGGLIHITIELLKHFQIVLAALASAILGGFFATALTLFVARKKTRAETRLHEANAEVGAANVQKIKTETHKTEIEIQGVETQRPLDLLDKNLDSMEGLIEFVQKAGLRLVNLENKVLELEREKSRETNARHNCEDLCEALKRQLQEKGLEIERLSEEVGKLKLIMREHNIPTE